MAVDWVTEFMSSEAAPAWTQAFLSAAAVFVAIWVVHRQHENDRRNQIESEKRRRICILAMVESVAGIVSNVIGSFAAEVDRLCEGRPESILLDEILRAEREALTVVPVCEINDQQLIQDVVDLKGIANIFPQHVASMICGLKIFDDFSERNPPSMERRAEFVDRCNGYVRHVEGIIFRIREAMDEK